ncbi:MAG: ABC transporter permease [Sphingobacteriaceae bacterium]|nr:ABC transporter permease [Sphingobacteriaceae bacterium]
MILIRLIGESFRFALDALRQNKLRTMLSLLAITIGIFTIIGVFSSVDTFRANLQKSVDKLGSNTLFVQKWPWVFDDFPWWKYVNRPQPSLRDYQALKKRMDNVDGIAYEVSVNSKTIKYRSNAVEGATINAATQDYDKTWNLDFQEGRYFTEMEGRTGAPICILGADIAEGLFADDTAIGKQIKMMGRRVTVVGVFKKEGDDMMGMSQDKNVLISLSFAKGLFDIQGDNFGPQITVRGKENIALSEVESELMGLMRSIHKIKPGSPDDFSLNKTTMISNKLDSLFSMVNIGGWVIGGFSILVGGFSIANIMFVSVKERTPLIGIQKSLGAKNYFILLQFMFEAVILALIGGFLGLLLVFLLTKLLAAVADFEIILSFANILLGLSISFVIGLISGFWPAYAASKLDPVEAIRS